MDARQDGIYTVVKAIEHSKRVGRSEMENRNIRLAVVEGKPKKTAGALNENAEVTGL